MNILLVFPPISLKERYSSSVGNAGGFLPPMGLCAMAATLEQAGHSVQIMDCEVNNWSQDDVLARIRSFEPEMVGISSITLLFDRTVELCMKIREHFPHQFIMIGGAHANVKPQETLKETKANIVLVGEADEVIVKIASNLDAYREPQVVKGEKVKDLNKLPYPARHLLDMSKYTSLPNNYKKSPYVFQMFTTRDCPYQCTFCAEAKGTFRQRSIEHVVGEIKLLQKQYTLQEVVFWDAVFTLNRKWVLDFCAALKRENIDLVWTCYTRFNLIDSEMLRAMKEAGCWNIFFGIESGNQQVLNNIKKGTTLQMIRNGVKMVKDAGMEIRGSFILGLPGETPEITRQTIDFAIELDPDYAQFSLATPFPGTELYETYSQWGRFDESDYKKFNIWNAVFLPNGYDKAEQLVAMQREAFRRFYFRPRYVVNRVRKIRSLTDLRRHLKGLRMVLGFAFPKVAKFIV